MRITELAALNLNQLVALEALLSECNVRVAAARMGVTQSAMSHTLRSLRELLSDPLLVRVGNGMVPTEYAEEISGNLRRGLAELGAVVRGRAAFVAGTIRDEFTLALHEGFASFLTAPLSRNLRADAPEARLKLTVVDESRLQEQLLRGEVDAAVVPPMVDLTGLQTQAMLPAGHCVLVREGHPRIKKRLTLKAFCETEHVLITHSGEGVGLVDRLLEPLGRQRRVAVKLPWVSALPELLVTSDLIATVPRPVGERLSSQWPLRAFEPPLPVPEGSLLLCWHERFEVDPAAVFFREHVRRAAEECADQLRAV